MPTHDATMSFGDHLEELRRRLVMALLGPIPIFVVCLIFGGPILEFLVRPVEAQLRAAGLPGRLLATGPAEPFAAYLKVALVVAVLLSGPWILYQAWLFVAPGLYAHEKRFARFLFPASAVLTLAGMVFLYTVLLPVMLRFFIIFGSFVVQTEPQTAPLPADTALPAAPLLTADPPAPSPGDFWFNETLAELRIAVEGPDGDIRIMASPFTGGGQISQQYRIIEYVNLVFALGIVFAAAFQLPLALLLMNWAGLVDPPTLRRFRRHAVFGCVIAGAIFTPADPGSMVLLALPLYGLYELGILLMRILPARRLAGDRPDSEDTPPDEM